MGVAAGRGADATGNGAAAKGRCDGKGAGLGEIERRAASAAACAGRGAASPRGLSSVEAARGGTTMWEGKG